LYVCLVEQARVDQSERRSDGAWRREVPTRSLLLLKLCGIWLSRLRRGRVCRLFFFIIGTCSYFYHFHYPLLTWAWAVE